MTKSEMQRLARSEVSAAAMGVLVVVVSFRAKGRCEPKRDQLIERSKLAANTLYLRLAELRHAGLLNMEETRDKQGRIRTAFVAFPSVPQLDAPCRKIWGKVLVSNPATRIIDFTHARARVDISERSEHQLNGKAAIP